MFVGCSFEGESTFFPETFASTVSEVEVFDRSMLSSIKIIRNKDSILRMSVTDSYCETSPAQHVVVEARYFAEQEVQPPNMLPEVLQNNTEYYFNGERGFYRKYIPTSLPEGAKVTPYNDYSFVHKYGYLFGTDKTDYFDGKYFMTKQLFLFSSYNPLDKVSMIKIRTLDYTSYVNDSSILRYDF